MSDDNKFCFIPHNSFVDIGSLTKENVKLFIEPSIKRIMEVLEKKLLNALDNGELKDFNFIEFRVETNFYKELKGF